MVRQFGQAAAQQGFHHHDGDVALGTLRVEIFAPYATALGYVPVHIVHLQEHEIPMIGLVQGKNLVKYLLRTVERPSKMAYASCLALLLEEIQHAIVHIAFAEVVHTAAAQGMEQVIVDVVHLQFAEGTVIHGQGVLARRIREVGQLG